MNPDKIRNKFGGDFIADERTFIMGIDQRFTLHFAERFWGLKVLEVCTGAGFTTMSLAKAANHVSTFEISKSIQNKAIENIKKVGVSDKVTFFHGNIMEPRVFNQIPAVDAAFIDPDWAVTGPNHEYRFQQSNTKPPADVILNQIFSVTENVAIVLPPFVSKKEFSNLPEHECESLYIGDSHELFCLYFGSLIRSVGESKFVIAT